MLWRQPGAALAQKIEKSLQACYIVLYNRTMSNYIVFVDLSRSKYPHCAQRGPGGSAGVQDRVSTLIQLHLQLSHLRMTLGGLRMLTSRLSMQPCSRLVCQHFFKSKVQFSFQHDSPVFNLKLRTKLNMKYHLTVETGQIWSFKRFQSWFHFQ